MFTHYSECNSICDKIIDYLQIKDKSQATFERVNTMIEFLQCYPIIVRRNKNAAPNMTQIFPTENIRNQNGKTLEETANQEYIEKLVQFTWTKVKEVHPNTSHAFRFFDVNGKGKIRKSDFSAGLEKLRIRLSAEDLAHVWQCLDK
jgi:hypothetical protein